MIKSRVVCGDALTVLQSLPAGIVDCGVTSPPYNKQEKQKGWLVKNVVYDGARDAMPEADYQKNQILVLDEIYRVVKPGGSFFYNHKLRWDRGDLFHPMDWLRKTHWHIRQEIIWDRMLAGNIRGWRFWQVEERIYWLHKPADGDKIGKELSSKDAKLTSVWRAVPENKNPHPAPFPLWLPARVILSVANKNGIVLDPYIGSGTTAVAAKLLGFNYVGIDISKEYIAHAEKRLQNCESEMPPLQKELELHKIRQTFAHRKQTNQNTGKYGARKKVAALL